MIIFYIKLCLIDPVLFITIGVIVYNKGRGGLYLDIATRTVHEQSISNIILHRSKHLHPYQIQKLLFIVLLFIFKKNFNFFYP